MSPSTDMPGLGLETTLQLDPFQCSASVKIGDVVLVSDSPTAQMSLAEMTATPWSSLNPRGAPFGVVTVVHWDPFHCSATVFLGKPSTGLDCPTAQTSLVETAATPFKMSPLLAGWGLPGFGLGTTLQAVPFQCSVRVWFTSDDDLAVPTAQPSPAAMAAAPFKVPSPEGVVSTLQVGGVLAGRDAADLTGAGEAGAPTATGAGAALACGDAAGLTGGGKAGALTATGAGAALLIPTTAPLTGLTGD
jgi:hypothetical protein